MLEFYLLSLNLSTKFNTSKCIKYSSNLVFVHRVYTLNIIKIILLYTITPLKYILKP